MGSRPRTILYLVRHGESMGNVTRRLLSAPEDVLTETGKQQAARLGEHLSEIRWTHAFSSDYPRAVDTALGILGGSSAGEGAKALLRTDARLRERHYGDLEGLSYREGFQKYNETQPPGGATSLLSILEFEMEGGEPVAACVARMRAFFRELFDQLDGYEGATVLAVSHSFALVAFMNDLSRQSEGAGEAPEFKLVNWNPAGDLKMMRNVSYMKIAIGAKEPSTCTRELEFLLKHETRHLDGLSTGGTFSNFAKDTKEAKDFSGCVQQ